MLFSAAQVTRPWNSLVQFPSPKTERWPLLAFKSLNTVLIGQRFVHKGNILGPQWRFSGRSRIVFQPEVTRVNSTQRKGPRVSASCLTASQIATSAFTCGTIAVLPFYTLMVVAPDAQLTKRTMESSIPYVVLGCLYAYLLYLSWSPDTLRFMFASKYWLPELPGITRMFSNEITVASAWIHLMAVDLFAARQVFHDGIKNNIETRHSVSLCLLFCPIGIAAHAITKVLMRTKDRSH
ncbi:uncharacterized protein A4U43_C06F11190 [Asparagus officinalis]|uniref:Uncharacterized protein n=1 Tax=Asparagus officinalis TaxID=4686 RepID=A0A5P1EM29_ASPOF|nr:protein MAO HUZI 4, chloroplastic-like [Asparagus officinalis]ONK66713.1 uncharacterized protein A4U43_C06F11190 [Asparagus officinalis]